MNKMLSVKFALFGILLMVTVLESKPTDDDTDQHWRDFMNRHGKHYRTQTEESKRKTNFARRKSQVEDHNRRFDRGEESYSQSLNEFSDMDESEFNAAFNGFVADKTIMTTREREVVGDEVFSKKRQTLPDTIDWRARGAVAPIENQGFCGSCWSFSATGSLEGQKFIKTGKLSPMSEQNLMDCAGSSYGNYGCNGGAMNGAFIYVISNNGLDSDVGYGPYVSKVQACAYKLQYNVTTCKGTGWVSQSESALQNAVANIGPISVAVDASLASFHSYSGGVYNDPACSSTNLNHGVLVVGYGTLNGVPYWLIKNSWGTSWGMSGFMYLARNANNRCGIVNYALYPKM